MPTEAERTEFARGMFEEDAAALGMDITRSNVVHLLNDEPWAQYTDLATGHRWGGFCAALGINHAS